VRENYLYEKNLMKRTLIIDDEADARLLIQNLIKKYFPEIGILGEAASKSEAIEKIELFRPDFVFLDINLGDGNGFEVMDYFKNNHLQCIFTTAYDEFAIRAFRYNAIDYLLKPIAIEEFQSAVNKVLSNSDTSLIFSKMDNLMDQISTKNINRITINTHDGLSIIKLTDIVRIEADGNYSTIYLNTKEKILASKSLKEFEELLPESSFCRTHQSHIVGLNFVKKMIKDDGGYLLMENGEKVIISRRKKEEVLQIISKM
jgi:two-component system LytT family response regulator